MRIRAGSPVEMTYSLAVDIGGTFTDTVLRHSSGVLTVDKVLTTHDLLDGFFAGVANVMKAAKVSPRDIDGVVVHATTIVTNALIERKGQPTALLVTEGFRDVLHIRNEHRYEMYDPQIEFPDPLVPSALTFGVAERVRADGTILRAPDRQQVEALASQLKANKRGFARHLLSQQFRQSRQRARRRQTARRAPAGHVHDPVVGDRAADPRISARLDGGGERLHHADLAALPARPDPAPGARGLSKHAADHAVLGRRGRRRNRRPHPARMIESGPAAGALAACHYAEVLGIDRPDVVRHGRHDGKSLPDR